MNSKRNLGKNLDHYSEIEANLAPVQGWTRQKLWGPSATVCLWANKVASVLNKPLALFFSFYHFNSHVGDLLVEGMWMKHPVTFWNSKSLMTWKFLVKWMRSSSPGERNKVTTWVIIWYGVDTDDIAFIGFRYYEIYLSSILYDL